MYSLTYSSDFHVKNTNNAAFFHEVNVEVDWSHFKSSQNVFITSQYT